MEGVVKIKGLGLKKYSEQQLVDCDTANLACKGGFPKKAFEYMKANGL